MRHLFSYVASIAIIFFNLSFLQGYYDSAAADELNDSQKKQFEEKLNEVIAKDLKGIKIIPKTAVGDQTNDDGLTEMVESSSFYKSAWLAAQASNAPNSGVVVLNEAGIPLDLISGDLVNVLANGTISVPGYALPPGGKFETVGAAGWIASAGKIAQSKLFDEKLITGTTASGGGGGGFEELPDETIIKAMKAIVAANDYIIAQLCKRPTRPTKITLNLSAGFKLVFDVQTGSQVEWDLDIICKTPVK
jgi:hypothetical protein